MIEPLEELVEITHAAGALAVASADPVALATLRPPGELGVDIATAEGQPLGIPLFYGGPYVGLLATSMRNVRQMPGRLAGVAYDGAGRRGFVLTLKPREQDIRCPAFCRRQRRRDARPGRSRPTTPHGARVQQRRRARACRYPRTPDGARARRAGGRRAARGRTAAGPQKRTNAVHRISFALSLPPPGGARGGVSGGLWRGRGV